MLVVKAFVAEKTLAWLCWTAFPSGGVLLSSTPRFAVTVKCKFEIAIKLKCSKIKASAEPLKFLLEWYTGSVNLYHSSKCEHFCVGGWGKETRSSSNMGNMGSPPSYTLLSVLRMCLAQLAGRWGNTWHWECFLNVSVWDKRGESPERKQLTTQDFPWEFAYCWSRKSLVRAECARADWERGHHECLGNHTLARRCRTPRVCGVMPPLPVLLFSTFRKSWFSLCVFQRWDWGVVALSALICIMSCLSWGPVLYEFTLWV